jgi:formylglycine-generating enzyme required for sulfatase activity
MGLGPPGAAFKVWELQAANNTYEGNLNMAKAWAEGGANEPAKPVTPGFVQIPAGTFSMGSSGSETGRENDELQHRVTVLGFLMSKYETTQGEYEALMNANPSFFKDPNRPVEGVTWYDAINYCNALSEKEGLTKAYTMNGVYVIWNQGVNGYRLPTEAEWEYACRAKTQSAYNTGRTITEKQTNVAGNTGYTKWAGSYAPNAWGLYDMHGNVWEWCWDWYSSYLDGTQENPDGAIRGDNRVQRGGDWKADAAYARSANRGNISPESRVADRLGFRVCRNAK